MKNIKGTATNSRRRRAADLNEDNPRESEKSSLRWYDSVYKFGKWMWNTGKLNEGVSSSASLSCRLHQLSCRFDKLQHPPQRDQPKTLRSIRRRLLP